MLKTIFVLSSFSLLLMGCASTKLHKEAVDDQKVDAIWSDVKRFNASYMEVPDYYSTTQMGKNFKVGQRYYIEDLRCQSIGSNCTN